MSTDLLLDLKLIYDRSELREDLIGLLVVLELGGDQVREVAEGFGSVEDL
jgi:hypothetical protein